MSDTNIAPATPSTQPAPAPAAAGVSLVTACVIAAVFSAFSGMASWHFASQNVGGTQVAVIDSGKIARQAMNTTLAKPDMNPEKAAAEADAFIEKLNKTMEEYTDAGIVVVNTSVALTRPAGNDITQLIAAKLGVKLQ
jgi:hypothetical protein